MKRLIVTYYCKEGMRQDFLDAVINEGVYEGSNNDKGCLQYEYFLPVEEKDVVVLLERWENDEVLQEHLKTPHIAKMPDIKERFVKDTTVEKFDAE